MSSDPVPAPVPALIRPGYEAHAVRGAATVMAGADKRAAPLASIDPERARLYAVQDSVAVIPVQGVLIDKLGWIGSSWATGYDGLRLQLAQAFADPEVAGIALDVDSYGGRVSMLFDLVDWIGEQKAQTGKPVAAILTETAYSAAYALAAVADSIAVPRTGGIGSIGVIMVHWEYSRWLEKIGDTPTIIKDGEYKADGNSFEPLSERALAEFQSVISDLRLLFAQTVARHRSAAGVALTADQAMATEARCYDGPAGTAEAVRLGLADVVLPPDQAFAAFAAAVAGMGAPREA